MGFDMGYTKISSLNTDILGQILSFLPMREKGPEQVNSTWKSSMELSVFYYLEPFTNQLKLGREREWYASTEFEKKALIRRFAIRSHPHCEVIGKLFAEMIEDTNLFLLSQYGAKVFVDELAPQCFIQIIREKCPKVNVSSFYKCLLIEISFKASKSHRLIDIPASDVRIHYDGYFKERTDYDYSRPLMVRWAVEHLSLEELRTFADNQLSSFKDDLAVFFAYRGEFEKSSEFITPLRKGEDNPIYVECAEISAKQGYYSEAKKFAAQAGSQRGIAYNRCAIICVKQRNYNEAKTFADEAGGQSYGFKDYTYSYCAMAYASQGDYIEAKSFAKDARSYKGGTYNVCAGICASQKNYIEAKEFADQAGYEKDSAYANCARICAEQRNYLEAKKFADAAGDLTESAYQECAKICRENGHDREAKSFDNQESGA